MISVELSPAQWAYLLGWCEAHRVQDETVMLTDIFVAIAQAQREAGEIH